MNNNENELEMTAIKAVAAASKTPFLTAFKVSMGVAAAQLLVAAIVLGSFLALTILAYAILR